MSSLFAAIFLFLLTPIPTFQQCKVDDPACTRCSYVPIFILSQLYVFTVCESCTVNRNLNPQTNMCICNTGFYSSGATTCNKCPAACSSCESQTKCKTCFSEYNRVLNGDNCVCAQNYESKNDDPMCKQKPNILMIVLSTIGSAICMVLGFVVCAFIRMRGSHQIHADKKKRSGERQIDIQIYNNAENADNNTSNMFWNTKTYVYREGELCSICLDPNPMFMTDCEHYFHGKCIYGWFKNKSTCPNCNNETDQKQLRRWCERCMNVVMPVVMNISINRPSKKSKKEHIVQTPVENQYCDSCQNEMSMEKHDNLSHQVSNIVEKQPQSADNTEIWR